MLTVVTGVPGNAKTLNVIAEVEAKRLAERRPVYYFGIDELKLEWTELASYEAWVDCPPNSLVVLDEAHKAFGVQSQGAKPPPHVEALAEHRHDGVDIWLVTQSSKSLSTFARYRAGTHLHFVRPFGMEYAIRYKWPKASNEDSKSEFKDAQSSRVPFQKEFFGKYKSAEVHTHRRELPWKKIALLVGSAAVVVFCVTVAFKTIGRKPKAAPVASSSSSGMPVRGDLSRLGSYWFGASFPRLAGVPESAPRYDELQKVKSQPRVEGCMQLVIGASVRCECTGPNHFRLDTPLAQCLDMVKRGWFDDTRAYPDVKAENVARLDAGSKGEVRGDAGATK